MSCGVYILPKPYSPKTTLLWIDALTPYVMHEISRCMNTVSWVLSLFTFFFVPCVGVLVFFIRLGLLVRTGWLEDFLNQDLHKIYKGSVLVIHTM